MPAEAALGPERGLGRPHPLLLELSQGAQRESGHSWAGPG